MGQGRVGRAEWAQGRVGTGQGGHRAKLIQGRVDIGHRAVGTGQSGTEWAQDRVRNGH